MYTILSSKRIPYKPGILRARPSLTGWRKSEIFWRPTILMLSLENTLLMGLKAVPTNGKKPQKLDVLYVVMWPSKVTESLEILLVASHCDGRSREIQIPSGECLGQRWLLSCVPECKAHPISLPNGDDTWNLWVGFLYSLCPKEPSGLLSTNIQERQPSLSMVK